VVDDVLPVNSPRHENEQFGFALNIRRGQWLSPKFKTWTPEVMSFMERASAGFIYLFNFF
jgi:hypothetical protein